MIFKIVLYSISALNSSFASELEIDPRMHLIQEVSDEKQKIVEKDQERRVVLRDLYRINEDIKKVGREKSAFETQKTKTQEGIRNTSKMISNLETRIETQKKRLNRRLRALFKFSGHGFLRLAFSNTNAHDLDRTLKYLKIVSDWDYNHLKDYQVTLSALKGQKVALDRQVGRLQFLEKKVEEKRLQLADKQKDRNSFLSKIESEKVRHLARLKNLREKTGDLTQSEKSSLKHLRVFESMLKPNFFELKGRLPAPIDAKVQAAFGVFQENFTGLSFKNKGIRYSCQATCPIRPIHHGKVVYQGRLPGYGMTIIVSHGEHYYSVYSGLAEITVSRGDRVETSTPIGTLTSQARAEQGLFYFEIRHFSEPLDPQEWIGRES